MGILGKIFTWWDGATIGTSLYSARYGTKVGEDHLGNIYYTGKDDRRWVIYNGSNDASRVPSEWHGWLHHTFDDVPRSEEHTSELQSLMRISYAVFCLKKKQRTAHTTIKHTTRI